MFQARRLLQQQFPTEPSIPQQELLLQQLFMSPRRDVVGSIGGDFSLQFLPLEGLKHASQKRRPCTPMGTRDLKVIYRLWNLIAQLSERKSTQMKESHSIFSGLCCLVTWLVSTRLLVGV
ncbi:hypothetical protein TNCV_3232081 [Trichonephila clavipes]|nr:hypothetical protein TNCV_3232081 [Trichonephila clavipes]